MARKKMDLNLDLTLILTMDLNFAVGKKGIALLEVAGNHVAKNATFFLTFCEISTVCENLDNLRKS